MTSTCCCSENFFCDLRVLPAKGARKANYRIVCNRRNVLTVRFLPVIEAKST